MQDVLSSSPDSKQATALYVIEMRHYRLLPRLPFKAKITLFYKEQAGPGDNASDLHSRVPPSSGLGRDSN